MGALCNNGMNPRHDGSLPSAGMQSIDKTLPARDNESHQQFETGMGAPTR
jgi:hypothetical protein